MTNWPEIARCFSVLRPVRWIDPAALDFLHKLDDDDRVIVACSGGADSVFLVLTALSLLGPDRLVIAHFNHGIRGREADEDERFVKELARALKVRFSGGHAGVNPDPSEDALREIRYNWLVDLYREVRAPAILLGHHADDLLETQLMGMLTGSGPAGLCTPMPVRVFPDGHVRVRPLLPMRRITIETTLKSLDACWREDSSNADTAYTRNWIRKDLLPLIDKHIPQDIYAGSRRTQLLMREAVHVLDDHIEQMDLDLSGPDGFPVAGLRAASKGIIRRVLFAWWMRHYSTVDLSTNAADQIIQMIQAGTVNQPVSVGVVNTRGNSVQKALIDPDGMLVLKNESDHPGTLWTRGCHWNWAAGPLFLPSGGSLVGEAVQWKAGEHPYRESNPAIRSWLHGAGQPLYVRQWSSGDRYRPMGAPGTRKLQDIFCDAKLNSEQKQALPVILNSKGEILWVPGSPPAEHAKISVGINSALRLTYRTL
jgi:tRNA(Ile)-lysidine synthase